MRWKIEKYFLICGRGKRLVSSAKRSDLLWNIASLLPLGTRIKLVSPRTQDLYPLGEEIKNKWSFSYTILNNHEHTTSTVICRLKLRFRKP
jgi:hypothetical protein